MSNYQASVTARPADPDPDLDHIYKLGALLLAADDELAKIRVYSERAGKHFVKVQYNLDTLKELVGALVPLYTLLAGRRGKNSLN